MIFNLHDVVMGFICTTVHGRSMAIEPESFDLPVNDYDFSLTDSPRSLIDQMSKAGGFTATKLAQARDILRDMRSEINRKSVV